MKQKPAEGQRPEMYFEEGGMPETVSHELCHSCAAKQEQCQHLQYCIIPLTYNHSAHIGQGMDHAMCCCRLVSTVLMSFLSRGTFCKWALR